MTVPELRAGLGAALDRLPPGGAVLAVDTFGRWCRVWFPPRGRRLVTGLGRISQAPPVAVVWRPNRRGRRPYLARVLARRLKANGYRVGRSIPVWL